MPASYDFQNLSFDDFERLCADLMRARLGVDLESFKTGRDGGIDLRYAPSKDRTVIVQCKRYAPAAFNRLYKDLRDKELAKVKTLNPSRYVVCTSCRLSPNQKDQLHALLSPHCTQPGDIFGADELNQIIGQHGDIERRHFKLWLGSTAILERVINAGIFAYSEHEVDMLQREVSRYVVHDGFYRALEMLDDRHHCIIIGIPGVGKTTAARLLLAHYLREGYEVISVTRDVDDAWRVLNRSPEAKQVIYYDDFLGQATFSQKLEKNEDRRLLELMNHCKASKNKRFILTTRDYILDQAVSAHEQLDRAKGDLKLSTVALDDYSPVIRARLLANHLQFSSAGLDVLQAVVDSKAYTKIIEHQNFLPRVVEQLCSDSEIEGRTPQQFIDNAIAVLNDPSRVWQRPFQQLSVDARHLAYALASMNGDCEAGRLENSWAALNAQRGYSALRTFTEVLREVEGSFTRTQKYPALGPPGQGEARLIRFVNPSVREFVMADLLNRSDLLSAVFSSAVSFNQLVSWKEARYSLSGRTPLGVAADFVETLAAKAVKLAPVGEPRLQILQDKQTIFWNSDRPVFTRLNSLFAAFTEMHRTDASQAVCIGFFGNDLSLFESMLDGQDHLWTEQVLGVFLKALKARDPVVLVAACDAVDVGGWADYARDFLDVRHLWECAGLVVERCSDPASADSTAVDSFIARTIEIVSEISAEDDADYIDGAIDELELVDLGVNFDDEVAQLKSRAATIRNAEDDQSEASEHLSTQYRQGGRPESSEDVDGIFRTMVDQLER